MRYRKVYSFLLVLLLASALLAQPVTTSIRGKVIDPEGNQIPGASVTLIGEAIPIRTAITSKDGYFTFLHVPPGEYSIKVELQGFITTEVTKVIVTPGRSAEITIPLRLGNIAENVTVVGGVPEVTPTQEELDKLFSEELDAQVENLQLPQGQILYNPPSEMMEQALERVEVKISQSLTEDLTEGLRGRGIPEVEKLLVGSSMKAILAGKDFEITALSETVQSVFSTGSTLWEWDIRPLEPGEKKLYLSIAVVFDTKYGNKAKSYPVMDRTITVKVDPKLHPRDWGRTLGTIAVVVGIVGSLLGIILALQAFFRRRRSTGRDVEP